MELTKLEGGYTNSAVMLKGMGPPLVAKIYDKNHGNPRVESQALAMMGGSGIAPLIYDSFEHDNVWCVVMEHLPGVVGQRFLDMGDMETSRDIYRQLGCFLATHVHSVPVNSSVSLPMKALVNPDLGAIVPADLLDETKRALDVDVSGEISLVHGDYGPQNILVDGNCMKMIDWEFAGWGNPLYDVAWVVWFVHLHYPHVCKELSKIFIDEYRLHTHVKIDSGLTKAFAVSSVVSILGGISGDYAQGRDEWIGRLRWTLGSDFTVRNSDLPILGMYPDGNASISSQ